MRDKTVLVTGATDGIGKQTALALAKLGARVVVTGRNRVHGEAAVGEIRELSGSDSIGLLLADLSTLAGIRSLANQFHQQYGTLDVLINNAGLAAPERRLTEDGVEADLALNVVAPFLLTRMLMDRLTSGLSARVVSLAGGDHPARIELDNVQAERAFVGLKTYSHAKLMMMAVMYEYAQRIRETNVTVNVCYPGQASTSMTQSVTAEMLPGALRFAWPVFKLMTRPDGGRSAAKASRSSVYLASSSEVEGVTGKYFDTNCRAVAWPAPVLDAATREQLWAIVDGLSSGA